MNKEELVNLLNQIENDKRKNRYFEKISYKQFYDSVKSNTNFRKAPYNKMLHQRRNPNNRFYF